MKSKLLVLFVLIWFVSSFLLIGCGKSDPPSQEEIYTTFQNANEEIQIVVDYLLQAEYESMFYPTSKGEVFADFERIPLDVSIEDAVHSLMKEYGIIRISKDIEYNALVFAMWTDKLECDCGVVYAINNVDEPYVGYLTQLDPLPESGWYYYVADYNEWRSNNS